MADTRQCVVFRIEVDYTTAALCRAADCFEGGGNAIGVAGYGELLVLEKGADGVVGIVFLVCCFGVGPDLYVRLGDGSGKLVKMGN